MSNRPSAAQVALLDTHLTHVLMSGDSIADLHIFVDATPVLTGSIESFSLDIVAPSDEVPDGRITAILSRYETAPDGSKRQSATALFPGTVEIVGKGRRISISCPEAGSFDGLWLGLGLRADGTADELTGVKSLRVLLAIGGEVHLEGELLVDVKVCTQSSKACSHKSFLTNNPAT